MNKWIAWLGKTTWKGKGWFRPVWLLLLILCVGSWLAAGRIKSLLGGLSRKETPAAACKVEPRPAENGSLRIYFSEPGSSPEASDNIVGALIGYIDKAQQTIDVCASECDNRAITNALLKAARRGVKVRLVTETNFMQESGVQALKSAGVPVVDDRRDGALMDDTFLIFDNRAVWTGSMNLTETCACRNDNNGLYIEDAEVAANFATKFGWMFEEHKFGDLPSRSAKIPHPSATLRDGTRIETYFSTHDHVAERLIDKISQAKSAIHFLAYSFTHHGIAQAMLDRAQVGIPIQGVFERTQVADVNSEYPRFYTAGPGVQVYLANPRNLHHKVIILDDEITVAGSFNFSDGSDQYNDENVVIIHSRAVAQQFEKEFFRIYDAARRTGSGVAVMSLKPK